MSAKSKTKLLMIGGGINCFIKRNDSVNAKCHINEYRFLMLGENGVGKVYSDEDEADERIIMKLDERKSRAFILRMDEEIPINIVFGIWNDERSPLTHGLFMEHIGGNVYRMIHWETCLTVEDGTIVYKGLFDLVCNISEKLSKNIQLRETYLKLLGGSNGEEKTEIETATEV